MNRGKFLNEWQVTDKIIEWIVFQFIFNLLQMTQTQEIINCIGFQKFTNGYEGLCMSGRNVSLMNDKWEIKLLSEFFFPIYIQPFMNDSNSKNNNL